MTAPTSLQLAIAAGALIGLGVALLTWRLVPAQPDLRDALDRLSPEHARPHASAPVAGRPTQRPGAWVRRLPVGNASIGAGICCATVSALPATCWPASA